MTRITTLYPWSVALDGQHPHTRHTTYHYARLALDRLQAGGQVEFLIYLDLSYVESETAAALVRIGVRHADDPMLVHAVICGHDIVARHVDSERAHRHAACMGDDYSVQCLARGRPRDLETIIGTGATAGIVGMGIMGMALTDGGPIVLAAVVACIILGILTVVWLRYQGAL